MTGRFRFLAALVGTVGMTLAGCSGGGPTLTGSVTFDNKPLTDAQVSFESRQDTKLGGFSAKTDAEGKFEVKADLRAGRAIKPGKYVVLIKKFVDKKGKVPNEEDFGQLEAAGDLVNVVPPEYSDQERALITVDITPGTTNLQPFQLTSKPR